MPTSTKAREKAAADAAVEFFPRRLAFSKDRFAGLPFELRPWQEKIIRDIFGPQVYDPEVGDWVRRIRTAYIEVPRKNGKTELGAGIALKLLFADGANGAEIYSVASDEDQAGKVFSAASAMVESNPSLKGRVRGVWKNLIEHKNGGIYRIIPGKAAGNHGHNPSGVIFDELHEQATRELWDVMTSGGGMRSQPLTVAFSTAGTDRSSICWEMHDKGEKWAQDIIEDHSFYYVRYGQSEGDDWRDREVWKRANPALGEFLLTSFLETEYASAEFSPGRQNAFRNLYLNEWTQQQIRWIDMGVWDGSAGVVVEPDLVGSQAFGGLYYAKARSMVAWVLVVPGDEGSFEVLPRFFLPESSAKEGEWAAQYRQWAEEGYITLTPGDVTDFDAIEAQILKDSGRFDLRSLAMRKHYMGGQIGQHLGDAFGYATSPGDEGLSGFLHSMGGYTFASVEFDRLLGGAKLHHGGNPVLRWMADTVVARTSPNGDIMPDVDASQGDISGICALLMALDLAAGTEESSDPQVAIMDM